MPAKMHERKTREEREGSSIDDLPLGYCSSSSLPPPKLRQILFSVAGHCIVLEALTQASKQGSHQDGEGSRTQVVLKELVGEVALRFAATKDEHTPSPLHSRMAISGPPIVVRSAHPEGRFGGRWLEDGLPLRWWFARGAVNQVEGSHPNCKRDS